MGKNCVLVINLSITELNQEKMIVAQTFYSQNWEVHIANLTPQERLSSEISDPKAWHAHPRMQTWQVPPGSTTKF